MMQSGRRRLAPAVLCLSLIALAGCSSDKSTTDTTVAAETTVAASDSTGAVETTAAPAETTVAATTETTAATSETTAATSDTTAAGAAPVSLATSDPKRCEENKAAGKITYLSGFDLAASASIVEMVVAQKAGYYEALCLDVDVKASFSTANYALVGANTAQFASAGSMAELLTFRKDGADLVAVVQDGKQGIDELLVRPEANIKTPADLKGKTIGVKGALPPAEVALLAKYGLKQGKDYKEVSLQGFDPKQHWAQPIDALPVYKSNEPGQLDAAGIKYEVLDPAAEGIPGSFGVVYSNRAFLDAHPTAAQDFVRASLRGLEDALANPDAAAATCFEAITAGGNKNFLSAEGELFRWRREAEIVKTSTPSGEPVGLIHRADIDSMVKTYTDAGVFTTAPSVDGSYDEAIAKAVYGTDGKVIWP
jgi:ABC-type nitrate/sulfonate/bicarbonate transport system substrate-binding protein